MNVGIDSYSYHRYFGETTAWEQALDARWQAADFIARAAQLGVDVVSFQTAYLPELTPDVIAGLRDQLDAYGLAGAGVGASERVGRRRKSQTT